VGWAWLVTASPLADPVVGITRLHGLPGRPQYRAALDPPCTILIQDDSSSWPSESIWNSESSQCPPCDRGQGRVQPLCRSDWPRPMQDVSISNVLGLGNVLRAEAGTSLTGVDAKPCERYRDAVELCALEEPRPQLEIRGQGECRVQTAAGALPQRAAPERRLLLDSKRGLEAIVSAEATTVGAIPR
jgi:hypothetical protein